MNKHNADSGGEEMSLDIIIQNRTEQKELRMNKGYILRKTDIIEKEWIILENPDNIVFNYIFNSQEYNNPTNTIGNRELEIFIVDVLQEKVIDIINTHDDLDYFWSQLDDTEIETRIGAALRTHSYQIENDDNPCNHYQLVAIASGTYFSYSIVSPSLKNVRFLESEPWKYFK